MLKICICDDDVAFGSLLESYINEYISKIDGLNIEIDFYESGVSLTKAIIERQERYQILFLDIEMQEMNGIETALKIRTIDRNLYIIYITSYEKYTLESFKVSPFRYIIKPVKKEEFQSILAQVVEDIMSNKQFFFFKYQNKQYQIKCDCIVTMKSEMGRMIYIDSTEAEAPFRFYGKIKEIEKELNPFLFIKVNSGTIVNLDYVNIITNDEIKMEDGETYPISRGQKQEVKKKYNNYLEKRLGL